MKMISTCNDGHCVGSSLPKQFLLFSHTCTFGQFHHGTGPRAFGMQHLERSHQNGIRWWSNVGHHKRCCIMLPRKQVIVTPRTISQPPSLTKIRERLSQDASILLKLAEGNGCNLPMYSQHNSTFCQVFTPTPTKQLACHTLIFRLFHPAAWVGVPNKSCAEVHVASPVRLAPRKRTPKVELLRTGPRDILGKVEKCSTSRRPTHQRGK